MAITVVQSAVGWREDAYETTPVAYGSNVTSGNLLVVFACKNSDATWGLVAADITAATSGTATLGTWTLDVSMPSTGNDPGHAGIFSAPVTGTGSCAVKLKRSQAGSGSCPWMVGLREYAGTDVTGSRVADTATGTASGANPATSAADSTGGAVFCGALHLVDAGAVSPASTDYSTVYDYDTWDSPFIAGSFIERIVSTATNDVADWTAGAGTAEWNAVLAVYKDSGAAPEDLKISQFTALTDPIVTDLVCIVDSTTSPVSSKLTINNLLDLFISDVTLTVLTATSGATYTPPAEAKKLLIGVVGGGGGGNGGNNTDSAGGGGGGGGTCLKLVSSTAVTNGTYVVGPGGGVSSAGTASSGINTTFNIDSTNILTAGGGGGGTQGAGFTVVGIQAAGGAGGTATGGDLNMPGKRGERGVIYTATAGWGGSGGDSVFGFGSGSPGVNTTGVPGGAYGGGGCGAHASAATNKEGAAGAKGTIFVLEFFG